MKIDEPKTPYNYVDPALNDCDQLDADALADKLKVAADGELQDSVDGGARARNFYQESEEDDEEDEDESKAPETAEQKGTCVGRAEGDSSSSPVRRNRDCKLSDGRWTGICICSAECRCCCCCCCSLRLCVRGHSFPPSGGKSVADRTRPLRRLGIPVDMQRTRTRRRWRRQMWDSDNNTVAGSEAEGQLD